MILPVIIRPEAELDLAATQLWYEAERAGLGERFRESVDHAVSVIGSHPLLFPTVLRKVRRVLLVRFPFALFYQLEEDRAVVLACVHAKRNPRVIRSLISKRRG